MINCPATGTARLLAKRVLCMKDYRKLRGFDEGRIHVLGSTVLKGHLNNSGLNGATVHRLNPTRTGGIEGRLGRF